jgi:hypothetical protein
LLSVVNEVVLEYSPNHADFSLLTCYLVFAPLLQEADLHIFEDYRAPLPKDLLLVKASRVVYSKVVGVLDRHFKKIAVLNLCNIKFHTALTKRTQELLDLQLTPKKGQEDGECVYAGQLGAYQEVRFNLYVLI